MLLDSLPRELGDAKALMRRHKKAAERKWAWRDLYREAYYYTMPERETFDERAPGQRQNRHLYDSTGLEAIHKLANRMQAELTPSWRKWANLEPGADVDPEVAGRSEIRAQLQEITDTVFDHINHSNFATIVNEAYLDLLVGTAALSIDEGDNGDSLVFDAVPLSVIELEEGPRGTIENVWREMKPQIQHVERLFPGAELSDKQRRKLERDPQGTCTLIYGQLFVPRTGLYYGVVIDKADNRIMWRWQYGETGPYVVARSTVVAGEIYGRGPVLWALPNIKSLNAMIEFVLRHSALQIAPPATAVSDGVMNPYTARLKPNTIIPVGSNDTRNPSLSVLDVGGNFLIGEAMIDRLQTSVKRMLLDDERRPAGPVRSATEVSIESRELIRQWGTVFGRIQAEFLQPIIRRVVDILQRRGSIPELRVDGRMLTLVFTSPLARAQDAEELDAFSEAMMRLQGIPPEVIMAGLRVEKFPEFVFTKSGADADLIRPEEERVMIERQAAEAAGAMAGG